MGLRSTSGGDAARPPHPQLAHVERVDVERHDARGHAREGRRQVPHAEHAAQVHGQAARPVRGAAAAARRGAAPHRLVDVDGAVRGRLEGNAARDLLYGYDGDAVAAHAQRLLARRDVVGEGVEVEARREEEEGGLQGQGQGEAAAAGGG